MVEPASIANTSQISIPDHSAGSASCFSRRRPIHASEFRSWGSFHARSVGSPHSRTDSDLSDLPDAPEFVCFRLSAVRSAFYAYGMPRLLVATKNAHKTVEIAAILGKDWEVVDLTGYPEAPSPEEYALCPAKPGNVERETR